MSTANFKDLRAEKNAWVEAGRTDSWMTSAQNVGRLSEKVSAATGMPLDTDIPLREGLIGGAYKQFFNQAEQAVS